ncbi:hypothetical protein NicSoilE8_40930 (plasmid) [Arthrobacter sp. NicSoilE8]|nr:hypothetical protein NicSoilE8_40930 [Arthrobacter sp. NicSoilE8]
MPLIAGADPSAKSPWRKSSAPRILRDARAAMNTFHPPGEWNTAPLWPRQQRCRQARSSTKDHSADQTGLGFGHRLRQERTEQFAIGNTTEPTSQRIDELAGVMRSGKLCRGRSRWPVDGSG